MIPRHMNNEESRLHAAIVVASRAEAIARAERVAAENRLAALAAPPAPEVIAPLRDVLPEEFFLEHDNSRANQMLDAGVIEAYGWEDDVAWPGTHRNVAVWWVLDNGYAVGWNENPGRGWSFPVVRHG